MIGVDGDSLTARQGLVLNFMLGFEDGCFTELYELRNPHDIVLGVNDTAPPLTFVQRFFSTQPAPSVAGARCDAAGYFGRHPLNFATVTAQKQNPVLGQNIHFVDVWYSSTRYAPKYSLRVSQPPNGSGAGG